MLARACVVIPMFNEATVIGDVVRTVRERFGRVVCVDDGSADEYCRSRPRCRSRRRTTPGQPGPGSRPRDRASGGRCVTRDRVRRDVRRRRTALGRRCRVHGGDRARVGGAGGARVAVPRRHEGCQRPPTSLLKMAVHFTRATTGMRVTDAHNGLRVLRRDAAERLSFRLHGMSHASEVLSVIARTAGPTSSTRRPSPTPSTRGPRASAATTRSTSSSTSPSTALRAAS